MNQQMKHSVAILLALLASLPALAQSNAPSAKPLHCSVKGENHEMAYPDSLKGSGIQGTVLLEAVIGEDGCTRTVTVVRKLNPELDRIAQETVNSWKFSPAMKNGKAVMVKIQIEGRFKDSGK
jgi:periplasmic protein TonB